MATLPSEILIRFGAINCTRDGSLPGNFKISSLNVNEKVFGKVFITAPLFGVEVTRV